MKYLLFAIPLFFSFTCFSEFIDKSGGDSIRMVISLPKAAVESENDLILTLMVRTTRSTPLEIPKQGLWSYVNSGPGFFFIEVQRKRNGKFVDVPGNARIDNVPIADIDTLKGNEMRKFITSMRLLFHYTKGQYRVRVLGAFSTLNNSHDIYSNWVYFNCEHEIVIN